MIFCNDEIFLAVRVNEILCTYVYVCVCMHVSMFVRVFVRACMRGIPILEFDRSLKMVRKIT